MPYCCCVEARCFACRLSKRSFCALTSLSSFSPNKSSAQCSLHLSSPSALCCRASSSTATTSQKGQAAKGGNANKKTQKGGKAAEQRVTPRSEDYSRSGLSSLIIRVCFQNHIFQAVVSMIGTATSCISIHVT